MLPGRLGRRTRSGWWTGACSTSPTSTSASFRCMLHAQPTRPGVHSLHCIALHCIGLHACAGVLAGWRMGAIPRQAHPIHQVLRCTARCILAPASRHTCALAVHANALDAPCCPPGPHFQGAKRCACLCCCALQALAGFFAFWVTLNDHGYAPGALLRTGVSWTRHPLVCSVAGAASVNACLLRCGTAPVSQAGC